MPPGCDLLSSCPVGICRVPMKRWLTRPEGERPGLPAPAARSRTQVAPMRPCAAGQERARGRTLLGGPPGAKGRLGAHLDWASTWTGRPPGLERRALGRDAAAGGAARSPRTKPRRPGGHAGRGAASGGRQAPRGASRRRARDARGRRAAAGRHGMESEQSVLFLLPWWVGLSVS